MIAVFDLETEDGLRAVLQLALREWCEIEARHQNRRDFRFGMNYDDYARRALLSILIFDISDIVYSDGGMRDKTEIEDAEATFAEIKGVVSELYDY